MTVDLAVLLIVVVLVAGLPWIVERIFKRRIGVWFGLVEVILLSVLAARLYNDTVQGRALCDAPVRIEGDAAIDHDAECRALFFLLYPVFGLVSVSLLLLIFSVFALFLVSRKRMQEGI